MARRAMTTLAAICVALLIYAAFIGLIISKLSSMIGSTSGGRRPTPLYANGNFNLFGLAIPIELVFIAAAMAITLLVLQKVFGCVRRHNREKLGQCVDCGYPLSGRRGRCPRCGLRYDRPGPTAHLILFPVLPPTKRLHRDSAPAMKVEKLSDADAGASSSSGRYHQRHAGREEQTRDRGRPGTLWRRD